MGAGCSTAVVGGVGCCWVVDVVRWVLAVVCHSLSSLHVVVDLAVVVFWPACLWWGLCDMAAGSVEAACVVVDVGDVGMHVIVVFCCQAVVVVCGRPGMFVVVGVTSGRRSGRPLLSWWLWDEEVSHVTICDNVTLESMF